MNKLLVKLATLSGILTGLGCFILFLVLLALGFQPLGEQQFVYFPIYALGMISAMKYFRDYRNNGQMHGWQGVGMGLIINLFASIFYTAMIYTWLTYVSPETFEKFKNEVIEKNDADFHKLYSEINALDTTKLNEKEIYFKQKEQIDAYVKTQEGTQYLTTKDIAGSVWIKTIGIGLLMGMTIGIFFKQSPSHFIQKKST